MLGNRNVTQLWPPQGAQVSILTHLPVVWPLDGRDGRGLVDCGEGRGLGPGSALTFGKQTVSSEQQMVWPFEVEHFCFGSARASEASSQTLDAHISDAAAPAAGQGMWRRGRTTLVPIKNIMAVAIFTRR
jgi:hypothetical protein